MNAYAIYPRHFSLLRFDDAPSRAGSSARVKDAHHGTSWSIFFVGIGVMLLLVGAGFLYLHQVNSSAAGGYDVSSLERRVRELKEEEQRLQLEAAELQSLHAVEAGVRRLNYVVTEQAAFTSPLVHGPVAFSGTLFAP